MWTRESLEAYQSLSGGSWLNLLTGPQQDRVRRLLAERGYYGRTGPPSAAKQMNYSRQLIESALIVLNEEDKEDR